ncbi:MAG: hypothetical protein GF330_09550 [Candidatus Eisenbacteria bacterium]|nr:hypothetical protein [Candidatus Eisenbacteria bacterium]
MSLIQQLDSRLKDAMRSKDQTALGVLRMVRTRLQEYARQNKISGEIPDAQVRAVIAAYVKQLRKSLPEFEKGGDAAAEHLTRLREEIAYLEPFLPQLLDEAATRALVEQAVAELGHPPPQRSGMVIGRIMKAHRGEVDPLLVRRLVEEALGA